MPGTATRAAGWQAGRWEQMVTRSGVRRLEQDTGGQPVAPEPRPRGGPRVGTPALPAGGAACGFPGGAAPRACWVRDRHVPARLAGAQGGLAAGEGGPGLCSTGSGRPRWNLSNGEACPDVCFGETVFWKEAERKTNSE